MKEHDDLAMVRKPSSALKKTTPRAQLILSNIVSDALALARKDRLIRIVVVNNSSDILKAVEVFIRYQLKSVTLLPFENSTQAWQDLSQTDPDLLITADAMAALRGEEIVRRLSARRVSYPIVVMSAFDPTELWVRDYARQGLNVTFLAMPFLWEDFRKLLERILKIPLAEPLIN